MQTANGLFSLGVRISMEMTDIVATANFVNSQLGSVTRKDRLRVPKHLAEELFKLKLAKPNPPAAVCRTHQSSTEPLVVGGGRPPVSLQAAPVLARPTAMLLRAPDGEPSLSTTPGDGHHLPTLSTPATPPGGKSTSRKSKNNSLASAGPKTLRRLADLNLTESALKTHPA